MDGEPPARSDNNGEMPKMPENAPNTDGTQPTLPEKSKNTNNSEGSSDSSKTPPEKPDGNGEPKEKPEGGFGDPMGMNNSAEEESSDFVFTRETRNFTNITYAESATESTKTTAA